VLREARQKLYILDMGVAPCLLCIKTHALHCITVNPVSPAVFCTTMGLQGGQSNALPAKHRAGFRVRIATPAVAAVTVAAAAAAASRSMC